MPLSELRYRSAQHRSGAEQWPRSRPRQFDFRAASFATISAAKPIGAPCTQSATRSETTYWPSCIDSSKGPSEKTAVLFWRHYTKSTSFILFPTKECQRKLTHCPVSAGRILPLVEKFLYLFRFSAEKLALSLGFEATPDAEKYVTFS